MFQWVASAAAIVGSFGTLYLSKKAENLRFKAMLLSNANETQYDDETIAVLSVAASQAYDRGERSIECEHLLAAAVGTNSLVKRKGLRKHPDVQRIVRAYFDASAMPVSVSPLPYASRAGLALAEATKFAIERGSPIVTPDDLLVGIARTGRGRAARALKAAGLPVNSVSAAKLPNVPGTQT